MARPSISKPRRLCLDAIAFLICPSREHRADGVSRSDRSQHNQLAFRQPAVVNRIAHRQRNCRGSSVSKLMNVLDYLALVEAELFGGRVDYSQIRLMRNEQT